MGTEPSALMRDAAAYAEAAADALRTAHMLSTAAGQLAVAARIEESQVSVNIALSTSIVAANVLARIRAEDIAAAPAAEDEA
jgi:transcriptional/translational regulatory protein YebC/TACO1